MADDFGFFSSSGNGAPAAEDDPAAAFLAQQESEIAGIENDEAFGTLEEAEQPHYPPSQTNYNVFGEEAATVNGDMFSESNGPTDSYAAIARVDLQRQEPESLRRWREEQRARLEELDSASKAAEAEWKERAKKELEDWHVHQSEQMEKNKVNNRYSVIPRTFNGLVSRYGYKMISGSCCCLLCCSAFLGKKHIPVFLSQRNDSCLNMLYI
uniref:Clathrin light chain n=1 Tax=Paramormyrops kingsleyae TaxID=1676925 RepID=A0A3B3QKB5_9TELE